MTCSTCNTNLVGRSIIGRSTPGYASRTNVGGTLYINGEQLSQNPTPRYVNNPGTISTPKQLSNGDNFLPGLVVGFIVGALVLTSIGRRIGYAAGRRVARRLER